jgi:hypothetical protein
MLAAFVVLLYEWKRRLYMNAETDLPSQSAAIGAKRNVNVEAQ